MHPTPRQQVRRRPSAVSLAHSLVSGGHPAPSSGVNPYDYSSDAGYQQELALLAQQRGGANADALNSRRQLALAYGDPEFARALGLDEATIAAAQNNPFSTYATQRANAERQPRELTQSLNKSNLYYSSAFGQQQSDLQRSLLAAQAQSQAQARDQASGIESSLRNTLLGADQSQLQAQQAAAARQQQRLGDLPVGQQPHPAPQPRPRRVLQRPAVRRYLP